MGRAASGGPTGPKFLAARPAPPIQRRPIILGAVPGTPTSTRDSRHTLAESQLNKCSEFEGLAGGRHRELFRRSDHGAPCDFLAFRQLPWRMRSARL